MAHYSENIPLPRNLSVSEIKARFAEHPMFSFTGLAGLFIDRELHYLQELFYGSKRLPRLTTHE